MNQCRYQSRMLFRCAAVFVALYLLCAGSLLANDTTQKSAITAARGDLLTGKYEKAAAAYRKLVATVPIDASIGLSRALAATGEYDKARKALEAVIKTQPKSAKLLAELAHASFCAGDLKAAQGNVESAIKLDSSEPQARWLQAELWREQGQHDKALAGYRWHFHEYNRREIRDAEELYWIACGVTQYVCWQKLHDAYGTLVNDVYPQILKLDPNAWRAHLAMGRLFLEKYNLAEAERQFVAGLKINPVSATLHAERARLFLATYDLEKAKASLKLALEINPRLLAAHQLSADLHFANFRPRLAMAVLNKAIPLRENDEATLGRLAAAYGAVDGFENERSKRQRIEREVVARSTHPGKFYATIARALDQLRRYPAAARYWRKTIDAMPQHPQAESQLGLVLMRLGDEQQAKRTLASAFKTDPFNVRVKNTLAVLDVLDRYKTIETDHFLIRFDPNNDQVLAEAAAEYLEREVFPMVTKQMGYTPNQKTLLEIFSRAKRTSGHGWFSARMVGLPYVGTVGACAGKMIAIASPRELKQKFNWAQVLKHEFIHVVNLQQTHFNIPHWFTEALAVHNEGYPRPPQWDRLLSERLASGKLFNLDTINYGFVRPESDDEWSLAYCQAELYAQFMLAEFGDDSIAKLLAAYADRLETRGAISRVFGVKQDEFERRYLDYVRKIVADFPKTKSATQRSFVELQKAAAREPDNADVAAQLALAHLRRRSYPAARQLVDKAFKAEPKHQLAAYVRARLHMVVGENKEALAVLERCLDRDNPQENALALLAGLNLKSRKYDEAAALYEVGARHAPRNIKWTKSLAVVFLQSGATKKLTPILEQLALCEPDNFGARKKLAQIYREQGDHKNSARWADEATHCNANDAESHRLAGEAWAALGDTKRAKASLKWVLLLDPQDAEAKKLLEKL